MAPKLSGRDQRSYSSLIYNAIRNAKKGKIKESEIQFEKALKVLKGNYA